VQIIAFIEVVKVSFCGVFVSIWQTTERQTVRNIPQLVSGQLDCNRYGETLPVGGKERLVTLEEILYVGIFIAAYFYSVKLLR
jgi:hypothetical protein